MRLAICLAVSSFTLILAGQPADAREFTPAETPVAVETVQSGDLRTAVLRQITERKAGADERLSRWLDELGTLYATEFEVPLWITSEGLTTAGKAVVNELSRADEWGLDPAAYTADIPASVAKTSEEVAMAEVEISLAAVTYASHASNGRLDPTELSLWYERSKAEVSAIDLLRAMHAGDAAKVLTDQHPKHEQFALLRQAYLKRKFPDRFVGAAEEPEEPKAEPIKFSYGGRVTEGERHEQIPLLRERLNVPAEAPEDEDLYDSDLVKAVTDFMRTQGWSKKRIFDDKVRKALNSPKNEDAAEETQQASLEDILVNMEKWRWLPRDLGSLHIWNNLPEFTTELVRNDEVLFSERIIIGKENTQTPVFSDEMTHVIFKPEWGVPSSIKIKTLLPSLAAGDYSILERRGMRIQHEGRPISPARYNWAKTDIRSVPVVMGAGPSNPLGRVKFMFPNHHAVYMHDTPDKHLFKNSQRTFSHGCIRVQDPARFAELILRETAGWSADDVAAQLARSAQDNHRVDLPTPIPVHNTYFTLIADKDGKLRTLEDIYDHDKRIAQALEGRALTAIAESDPARAQKREMERLAKEGSSYALAAREDNEFYDYQGWGGGNSGGNGGGFFLFSSNSDSNSSYNGPPSYKKQPKKKKSVHTWSLNPYAHGFNSD